MDVLSISDFANDEAEAAVTYRKHKIEFTFRPGAYLGKHANVPYSEVLAACVTQWNIDMPLVAEELEALPLGVLRAVYLEVFRLATQVDLPEVPEKSPTG